MTLIELFESKPAQDVGTFNSIFKTCPIIGHDFSSEVEILNMTNNGRRIKVGNEELFMNLPNSLTELKKVPVVVRTRMPRVSYVDNITLPKLYKELKPSQFMVYSALKELGEVHNVTKLSDMLNMNYKTLQDSLKELYRKGLISSERVISNKGSSIKISIDAAKKLI
jgi:hypothetical protein